VRIIGNAVNWAMKEVQPVSVVGLSLLDVTCWPPAASMMIHMANPYVLRSAYREEYRLAHRIKIRVPTDATVRAIRQLVSGQTRRQEQSAGNLIGHSALGKRT